MDYTDRLETELDKGTAYYPCDVCTDAQQWRYGGAGRCHNGCPHVAIKTDVVNIEDDPFAEFDELD